VPLRFVEGHDRGMVAANDVDEALGRIVTLP